MNQTGRVITKRNLETIGILEMHVFVILLFRRVDAQLPGPVRDIAIHLNCSSERQHSQLLVEHVKLILC